VAHDRVEVRAKAHAELRHIPITDDNVGILARILSTAHTEAQRLDEVARLAKQYQLRCAHRVIKSYGHSKVERV